ncbi:surfeit locus protein 6-like [Chenopodium quinoa]|nr:surfeit locus protein 6-like [Chenopodium quinoa]
MKKKKQTSDALIIAADDTTASAVAGNSSDVVGDIKTLVKDHASFFDKLVELIPAKFYLPTNDDEKPWFQGLSKAAKAEAKLKSIENTKKSRRDRLDPEKSSKSTLDLLKESLESKKSVKKDSDDEEDDDGGGGGGGGFNMRNLDDDKRSVTYEELRQRLHRRIEELRASRGDGSGEGKRRKAERREMKDGRKRWRDDEREENIEVKEKKENERDIEKEVSEAAKGIEFGKVKLAASSDDVSKKKKRRLSKEKELQRAQKLEEAMKDPEKGGELAKQHSWKSAMERTMGNKVHDDPKLLKKSLQKDKKKHAKSVEKWKQRIETTEKMKRGKQDKRNENIKAKKDKKKQSKIDKREKKLMRPGFEGRKEGFVTGN